MICSTASGPIAAVTLPGITERSTKSEGNHTMAAKWLCGIKRWVGVRGGGAWDVIVPRQEAFYSWTRGARAAPFPCAREGNDEVLREYSNWVGKRISQGITQSGNSSSWKPGCECSTEWLRNIFSEITVGGGSVVVLAVAETQWTSWTRTEYARAGGTSIAEEYALASAPRKFFFFFFFFF